MHLLWGNIPITEVTTTQDAPENVYVIGEITYDLTDKTLTSSAEFSVK